MPRYLAGRLAGMAASLLAVTFITFALGYYGPGDPVRLIMGQNWMDEAQYRSIRHALGLDRPFAVQYVDYLGRLAHGDFGNSYFRRSQPVGALMAGGLAISLQLGALALLVLVAVGVPLGIVAALRHNSALDYLVVSSSIIAHAIPPYALAPLLLTLLVLGLHVLPTGVGWQGIFNLGVVIPVTLLVLGPLVYVVRQVRNGVLEALGEDYVRTARAKGMSERAVLVRHVLPNALTPFVTQLGLITGGLLIGSIFVEDIFSIPGFGGLVASSLRTRDYPLLMGTTVVAATITMTVNLLVDVAYGFLDPRVRQSARR